MITRENIGEIFNLLSANYGEKMFPDDAKKMANVVNLWQVMFADDEPAEVLVAVKDCIASLQFPPKIADIKSRISQNRMAGQMTEMEAWTMVYKAIMDVDGLSSARKAFDKLPRIAQDLIGMPEQMLDWKEADGKTLTTVIASNFMRSYKVKAEREASYHALPADMQKAESWKLPKAEEKPKELKAGKVIVQPGADPDLTVGFELPPYMRPTVERMIADGKWTVDEIKQTCYRWGL